MSDTIANLSLESSSELKVTDLRLDLNNVRNEGEEGCQREHTTEENNVAELEDKLHVMIEHIRLVREKKEVSLGLEFTNPIIFQDVFLDELISIFTDLFF